MRVQIEVKIRKLISEGDQYHAQLCAAVKVRRGSKVRWLLHTIRQNSENNDGKHNLEDADWEDEHCVERHRRAFPVFSWCW